MNGRYFFSAFLLLTIGLSVVSAQQVLKVPSQYKTIQAAINSASRMDTVLVAPETYYENIDFKGKAITVTSSDGPYVTTINGNKNGRVVTMINGEDHNSVLNGFTITGGFLLDDGGAGIFCNSSSPVISNNIITNNESCASINSGAGGGGIAVSSDSSPIILNNIICYNIASAISSSTLLLSMSIGGGINNSSANCLVLNNYIFGNLCYSSHPKKAVSLGGGIFTGGGYFYNNSVTDNILTAISPGPGLTGSGIYNLSSSTIICNSIIWGNKGSKDGKQLGGNSSTHPQVSYSCIEGGYSGKGNIRTDPLFVNPAKDDFHLRFDSPCKNSGLNSPPQLPATDFEGDPRISDGTVDMGADEFFPHLYHSGNCTPGGTIQIKLIGNPEDMAFWAFSGGTLPSPLSLPGFQGLLYLDPGSMTVIPMAPFPSTGLLSFPFVFPTRFPKIPVPTQALMGTQLSNLDMVHVK